MISTADMPIIAQIQKWFSSLTTRPLEPSMTATGLVKIAFEYFADAGAEYERVWARSLGENLYQIENIPVCVSEFNLHDIVRCERMAANVPCVKELVQPSGNKTLRIVFARDGEKKSWEEAMTKLQSQGVTWERVTQWRYVLNIPPQTDFRDIRAYLQQKDDNGELQVYDEA